MEYQQMPPPAPPLAHDYDIPARPKSWLLESIIATLVCMPFGVVGLVNAVRVNSLYDQTLYEKSKRVSANAKRWTLIGFGISIFFITLIFLISQLGSLSEMNLPMSGGEPLFF